MRKANSQALFVTNGAVGHSDDTRAELDYYATPPRAVEQLLQLEKFSKFIWEPFCGGGHVSKVLEAAGHDVESSDLQPRGYGFKYDFFSYQWDNKITRDIISNPPYGRSCESVQQALRILKPGRKLALLLKVQFLESQERYPLLQEQPPKVIYCSVNRIYCATNGDFEALKKPADGKKKSSAAFYCWFVWEKGWKGNTIVKHFNY